MAAGPFLKTILLAGVALSVNLKSRYRSDDLDDLLEGVIMNKHVDKPAEDEKPKGTTDQLVEDAYNNALRDAKSHAEEAKAAVPWQPQGVQEQWAAIYAPEGTQPAQPSAEQPAAPTTADPLEDVDLYATEPKHEEEQLYTQTNFEETELDDDITDVLTKSFTTEKKRTTFVSEVPQLIEKKKDANFGKLFAGVTESDVASMEI